MAFGPQTLKKVDFVVAFAAAPSDRGANGRAIGVLVNDKNGAPLRNVSRVVETDDPVAAAYEAIIVALQEARGLRAGRVAVFSDNEVVAAQLNGRRPVPDRLERLFLQARTLIAHFRWAGVRHGSGRRLEAARRAALTAAASAAARPQPHRGLALQLSFAV